jgi:hypothetical protein
MPICKLLTVGLLTTIGTLALAQNSDPDLSFEGMGSGWQVATFPQQKMPVTRYQGESVDGRASVRMEARSSYGPLVHAFTPPQPITQLQWSWRVAQQGAAIDLRSKAGDDSAAKVCLSFVWDDARVPFLERQLLRLARLSTGQALPASTLCWVWGALEAAGEAIDNPYSRRVRSIVLRNVTDVGTAWFDERRDVMRDLRQTFGDEWPAGAAAPLVTAVFIAADADNTASHSIGWVSKLHYAP